VQDVYMTLMASEDSIRILRGRWIISLGKKGRGLPMALGNKIEM
jgi:hypothetical protein